MKVILNGLTLDKNESHKVIKSIANDSDIKKLLRKGRNDIHRKFLIYGIFVISEILLYLLYNFYSNEQTLNSDIGVIISNIISYFYTHAIFVTIVIFLYLLLDSLYFTFKTKKIVGDIWKYFKYIIDKKSPRRPLDIWSFFVSNLSDSHSLISATKLLNDDIKYIYCGLPYYGVEYIDSILIEVAPEIKKMYPKFYKNFAIESYNNFLKNKIHEDRKILQSKYVFGIFFFSRFLFKVLHDEMEKKEKIKFHFEFSLENETKLEYAKEIVKLCSDPTITSFNNDSSDNESINIIIKDIIKLDDEKPKLSNNNQILIPFKRFIALPINYGKSDEYKKRVDGNLILPEIPDFFSLNNMKDETILEEEDSKETGERETSFVDSEESVIEIFSMGGTEHNLPLLHIINHHRWSTKKSRFFGIAENKFDEAIIKAKDDEISKKIKSNSREDILGNNIEYNVGASHFVFGINAQVRQRIIQKDDKEKFNNEAEVFRLKIENDRTYDILSFYGYSAPMTRISFLKYLHEICSDSDTPFKPKLVENGEELYGAYQLYRVGVENDDIFKSDFLAKWDKFDCMNHPWKFYELTGEVKLVPKRHP